jgi:hypothetical protein
VSLARAEAERLGASRVLLLTSPPLDNFTTGLREALGGPLVAEFDDAVMRTPFTVTEQAIDVVGDSAVQCLVAMGGGSTSGFDARGGGTSSLPRSIHHFAITAPGHQSLITQLFVRGGAYLDASCEQGGDTVFGVKGDLIVDFVEQSGPAPQGA